MSHRKLADVVLPGTFEVVHQPLRFRSPDGSVLDEPGVPVDVLCALGRPDNFLAALRGAGVSLATIILKPDHDPLTAGNLFEQTSPGEPIVVTAKDWVKLRERPDIERRNIVIARQDVTIEPADKFRTWLEQRLDEVEPQA